MYCGKILVPAYRDEEAQFVRGQHEPLVSEAVFYAAQDTLSGRKRQFGTQGIKIETEAHMVLRGFLECPRCSANLTSSTSTGKYSKFSYYHCTSKCGFRKNVVAVNEAFEEELKKYVMHPAVAVLYKSMVLDMKKTRTAGLNASRSVFEKELNDQQARIDKLRELLMSGAIEPADYSVMKQGTESRIRVLQVKLLSYEDQLKGMEQTLDEALDTLINLRILYRVASVKQKRQIIGAVFPKKIRYENGQCRTPEVNEAARLTHLISSELTEQKKETNTLDLCLSQLVPEERLELSRIVLQRLLRPQRLPISPSGHR
jgi:site-specific DNA recombinase